MYSLRNLLKKGIITSILRVLMNNGPALYLHPHLRSYRRDSTWSRSPPPATVLSAMQSASHSAYSQQSVFFSIESLLTCNLNQQYPIGLVAAVGCPHSWTPRPVNRWLKLKLWWVGRVKQEFNTYPKFQPSRRWHNEIIEPCRPRAVRNCPVLSLILPKTISIYIYIFGSLFPQGTLSCFGRKLKGRP